MKHVIRPAMNLHTMNTVPELAQALTCLPVSLPVSRRQRRLRRVSRVCVWSSGSQAAVVVHRDQHKRAHAPRAAHKRPPPHRDSWLLLESCLCRFQWYRCCRPPCLTFSLDARRLGWSQRWTTCACPCFAAFTRPCRCSDGSTCPLLTQGKWLRPLLLCNACLGRPCIWIGELPMLMPTCASES